LTVIGIDLRDPAQVVALADEVAAAGPLDILINNAAQTVRRSPGAYAPLAEAERAPLPDGPLPRLVTFEHASDAHPAALVGSVGADPAVRHDDGDSDGARHDAAAVRTAALAHADRLTAQALLGGSSSLDRLARGDAIDAGGL